MPEQEMRRALDQGELRLTYHPIVALDSGRPFGAEALLRWHHPDEGVLWPDEFLPAVAHTPVMHEVTRWVVAKALDDIAAWPGWTVSVNVTAYDVSRPQFAAEVAAAVEASGVEPDRLILELTEQAVLESFDVAVQVLREVCETGVCLSLDDFGTGYSSLLRLRDLPFTEIKVDRAFLSGVPTNQDNLEIVRSVAQLGHRLGLNVVAEGIETAAQARGARAAGCHAAQGFLWGMPMDAEDLDPLRVVHVPGFAPLPPGPTQPSPRLAAKRITELLEEGASLHTIAAALNREGFRTPRLTRWTPPSVAAAINDLSP
jgi:EAL domain-containing protein (putative c-di-GMP-specific phosphodiesterase class I)